MCGHMNTKSLAVEKDQIENWLVLLEKDYLIIC